jgi:hypothetical protein
MPVQAAAVLEVCRSRGVPLLINDRVDVALAVGADGVHVGQVGGQYQRYNTNNSKRRCAKAVPENTHRSGLLLQRTLRLPVSFSGCLLPAWRWLSRPGGASCLSPALASSSQLPLRSALQGDLPAATVRRMIGPDRILGVSVKTPEQVRATAPACC